MSGTNPETVAFITGEARVGDETRGDVIRDAGRSL
jgi:hypothetical protein